jgi:cobalt/nickel transport system permease protein
VSHVHVPDGVLPPLLWAVAWGIAFVLLLLSSRALRDSHPQQVAYRGALGALTLAAMAIEVPIGPVEYHLTMLGPIGVLLGPAAAFQVMFVASAMLAFIGHGGFTVIGLNALVLGAGVAVARPLFRLCARGRSGGFALAVASVGSQLLAGTLWLIVMVAALKAKAWMPHDHGGSERASWLAGLALPLWGAGIVVESMVAYGLARFLERVRPDLLPLPPARAAGATTPA